MLGMIDGYMIEADYDGETLRVHPKNKVGAVALMGQDHHGDLILPRAAIADVQWKDASRMVNGKILITTAQGIRHQLHFRHKQRDGMRALYDSLRP
jgi:hypothetical protein